MKNNIKNKTSKNKNIKNKDNKNIINNKKVLLLKLFELIGHNKKDISQLNNIEISRDVFLDKKIVDKCYHMINDLRKEYSSNILTCLHLNSLYKQKFPGINMFRQILKDNNFNMKPIVISDGYCPITGNKKVIRSFIINQIL